MVDEFEAAGMKFVGRDTDNERMEIMELSGHPFYVAVQYHPEYLSRPMKPSPPYLGLILAATDKLQSFLSMVSSSKKSENGHDVPYSIHFWNSKCVKLINTIFFAGK